MLAKKAVDTVLALDAGSPVVSVAVGRPGAPKGAIAERSIEIRRSSERLVALVDECLRESGVAIAELAGILTLRGPGSFTGLRVGLATTLGFHQALGLPATAIPSHEVLALHGALRAARPGRPVRVAAVVDALRGQWFTRLFEVRAGAAPSPVGDGGPEILDPAQVAALAPDVVCGFGAARLGDALAEALGAARGSVEIVEPAPLAPDVLRLAALRPIEWRPETLVSPLYLRAPAVSLPRRP